MQLPRGELGFAGSALCTHVCHTSSFSLRRYSARALRTGSFPSTAVIVGQACRARVTLTSELAPLTPSRSSWIAGVSPLFVRAARRFTAYGDLLRARSAWAAAEAISALAFSPRWKSRYTMISGSLVGAPAPNRVGP